LFGEQGDLIMGGFAEGDFSAVPPLDGDYVF
jgi:hypothetical protein